MKNRYGAVTALADINGFLKGSAFGAVVPYDDIPDIPLYMDQMTTFIEDRLRGYKRFKGDKILTKTMINNYTKDAVLPPPERKKYDRDHIALLILIYHLKAVVSINDISSIFDIMEDRGISVETVYRAFTRMQEAERDRLTRESNESAQSDRKTNDDATESLFAILAAAAEANSRKLLTERLIDFAINNKK